MNAVIYGLAFIGAWFLLAVVGGFIFGVFFRGATAEDRAAVDLPDVGEPVLVERWREPVATTGRHLRVLGSGGWSTSHDPATCDACRSLDRGGF